MLWSLDSRVARCVLGFAVLNVMNAVICLDYCRYDKSILPRRLSKPLPSVWPTFFVRGLAAYCFITRYLYSRQCALQSWTKIWPINRGKDLNLALIAQLVQWFQIAEILTKNSISSMLCMPKILRQKEIDQYIKKVATAWGIAEMGSMIMFFPKQQKA